MSRFLNIPASIAILFFSYVFLYFATARGLEPLLAIVGGAMIPISAVLLWFDFARKEKRSASA